MNWEEINVEFNNIKTYINWRLTMFQLNENIKLGNIITELLYPKQYYPVSEHIVDINSLEEFKKRTINSSTGTDINFCNHWKLTHNIKL